MPDIERLLRHGLPMVVGVVFLGGGVWLHQRDALQAKHWVEVRGVVVDGVRERDGDQWAPVVEFEAKGERLRVTGTYGASRPTTGSELKVLYDPDAPEQTSRVVGPFDELVAPAVLVMGLATLLAGIIGALREAQSAQQRKPVE